MLAAVPGRALASTSLYWGWAYIPDNTSVANSGIAVTRLDGSGGGTVPLAAGVAEHPLGEAIDAATGTIYWASFGNSINYCSGPLTGGNTISYAKLNGTGVGTLNTAGATVSGPDGLAIDPTAHRIYWANDHANSISYADENGGGGHDLNTAGATLDCPAGIAVDPALGKIFWTNFHGNTISYANLDGSGGGDLPIAQQAISGPWGLAIDSANGKLYWANYDSNSIGYANLDGSGTDILRTTGATVQGPWGVAIDPSAGLIYWANNTGTTVSYSKLDETGAGNLSTSGAPVDHPKYPMLLEPPVGTGSPRISGGGTIGSQLACSPGIWAADLPESFLYRAPEDLAYRWLRDGVPVGSSSSAISANLPGNYVCQVTASNFAGSSAQASAGFIVTAPASNAVLVMSHRASKQGVIALTVLLHAPGSLSVTATFEQKVGKRVRTGVYGRGTVGVTLAGIAKLTVDPRSRARTRLSVGRAVTVTVALTFRRVDGAVAHARVRLVITSP